MRAARTYATGRPALAHRKFTSDAVSLFAVTSLEQLAEIHTSALSDRSFAAGCRELADRVRQGITAWASAQHGRHGEIYAFEADGYGNQSSWTTATHRACCRCPIWLVLGDDNPYFYKGTAGEGLGGPHSGKPHMPAPASCSNPFIGITRIALHVNGLPGPTSFLGSCPSRFWTRTWHC